MDTGGSTILGMAKERTNKPKKLGRPATGRTPTTTVFARISPDLGKALEAYVESVRPRTTTTAVVSLAIEEHLARVGFWPPAGAEE
jgi:hypothetical protein